MKSVKLNLVCLDMVFQDGKTQAKVFTPTELAGFKRSKKYKQIISKKKLFAIDLNIKIPAL